MPCKNGTRESMEESRRSNQERRDYYAEAERKRAPLDALRKSGHRMQFHHYFDLEDPPYEIFRVALDIVYNKEDERKEFIDRLTQESRLVYLLWCFNGEIHNGGFDQLFTNTLGNHCLEILEGLNTIGAIVSHELLRQAISKFPDSKPSTNRRERWAQHEMFADQQAYQTLIDRLDRKFYKEEVKLPDLINDYVMCRGNTFISSV